MTKRPTEDVFSAGRCFMVRGEARNFFCRGSVRAEGAVPFLPCRDGPQGKDSLGTLAGVPPGSRGSAGQPWFRRRGTAGEPGLPGGAGEPPDRCRRKGQPGNRRLAVLSGGQTKSRMVSMARAAQRMPVP